MPAAQSPLPSSVSADQAASAPVAAATESADPTTAQPSEQTGSGASTEDPSPSPDAGIPAGVTESAEKPGTEQEAAADGRGGHEDQSGDVQHEGGAEEK